MTLAYLASPYTFEDSPIPASDFGIIEMGILVFTMVSCF